MKTKYLGLWDWPNNVWEKTGAMCESGTELYASRTPTAKDHKRRLAFEEKLMERRNGKV